MCEVDVSIPREWELRTEAAKLEAMGLKHTAARLLSAADRLKERREKRWMTPGAIHVTGDWNFSGELHLITPAVAAAKSAAGVRETDARGYARHHLQAALAHLDCERSLQEIREELTRGARWLDRIELEQQLGRTS